MRTRSLVFALACGFGVASLQAAPPAHDHDHDHDTSAAAVEAPVGGWATDAPLREGMARVKAALADLAHYEMGHMPASMASERAADIEGAVKFMFTNCKLPPEPDNALHAILLPLLAAAQRLENDPADMAAVAAMRDAVAPYGRQFDDAAWRDAGATPTADDGAHAH